VRNRSIYSYSWDLAENGVVSTVTEFKGIGIDTITLACSYHAGKFLRPKAKTWKIYFPEDGTVYFQTNPARYGGIKPVANSVYGTGDVLRELTQTPGLEVHAWLVLLHNSKIVSENLESTVQNAFGDRYIYGLCPSAPEARAYAVGLAQDVSESYEIAGISMESIGFPPYKHGYHHEMSSVKLNKWLSSYLGLCFCTFCVRGTEKIGIDAERLKSAVAELINDYLAGDIDFPDDMAEAFWLADVQGDRELRSYLDYRSSVVTSLVLDIRKSVRKDVVVAVISSVARPTGGARYEGTDLEAIAGITGVIEACLL
jgi:hypothetical protein